MVRFLYSHIERIWMTTVKQQDSSSLFELWQSAVEEVRTKALLGPRLGRKSGSVAMLFWGKASLATRQSLEKRHLLGPLSLTIAPKGKHDASRGRDSSPRHVTVFGEHPLPGAGSFEAGREIIDFFSRIQSSGIRNLEVFLSGGASSLAWIKPADLSYVELAEKLEALYKRPLPIAELNRERSRLCALKGGGAARLLGRIAPNVRAGVWTVSDVLPFGPEVIGSGPFWDGSVKHTVLADNSMAVEALVRTALKNGFRILRKSSGLLGTVDDWTRLISDYVRQALRHRKTGLVVLGGEPAVKLAKKQGRGGRQCHIAASLMLAWLPEILQGRLEILCGSTDGVDGHSRAAGAWIRVSEGSKRLGAIRERHLLSKAIDSFDSASYLETIDALLPSRPTGTNVQDLVVVRVRGAD
jgi:glycerate-2-kinase